LIATFVWLDDKRPFYIIYIIYIMESTNIYVKDMIVNDSYYVKEKNGNIVKKKLIAKSDGGVGKAVGTHPEPWYWLTFDDNGTSTMISGDALEQYIKVDTNMGGKRKYRRSRKSKKSRKSKYRKGKSRKSNRRR